MSALRTSLALLALLLALSVLGGGCSGDEEKGPGSADQAPVAQPEGFPNAVGKSLADLRKQVGETGPVLAPVVSQLSAGSKNRLAFGLFDRDRAQIARAEVAVYVAPMRGGPATGPFTARYESLEVKPQFRSRSTSRAAKSVYVADVPFKRPGNYELLAVLRLDERLVAATPAGRPLDVADDDPVPDVGDKAPRTAEVIGEKPAIVLVDSRGLCSSRVCGPTAELAEQVSASTGGQAALVRVEAFRGGRKQNGPTAQVRAWKVEPIEPWAFTVDREGRVAARLEGAFSARELRRAVARAMRG